MSLPPPTSFAEGQRELYGLLAAAAGMFAGAVAIGLVAILVWGGWPATLYGQIVAILGWTLAGFIAAMAAVIVGLMVGGPVGRFKGSAGKDGISIEADNGAGPTVTATATVTPAPDKLP